MAKSWSQPKYFTLGSVICLILTAESSVTSNCYFCQRQDVKEFYDQIRQINKNKKTIYSRVMSAKMAKKEIPRACRLRETPSKMNRTVRIKFTGTLENSPRFAVLKNLHSARVMS